MTIIQVAILCGVSLLGHLLITNRWRGWFLMGFNIFAIYWLQPAMPIRGMDFWLPTMTVTMTVLSWVITARPEERLRKTNWRAGLFAASLVVCVALTRFISNEGVITASRPPQFGAVIVGLIFIGLVVLVLARYSKPANSLLRLFIIGFILIFVFIKLPALMLLTSKALRIIVGQNTQTASVFDIRWLGYSYVVFRIIHTIRDRMTGRLPDVNLQEYINYIIFYPSMPAGPIDRVERFVKDLRAPVQRSPDTIAMGAERIFWGLIKKFIIADSLAIFSLNAGNALQVNSTAWQWIIVYAYTIQIYMDFSGYTDLAIGMACWLGVRLPENFNRPYIRGNLTQFWNNWHMSLTQWFRSYYFNPLTRSLKAGKTKIPAAVVVLVAQVSTMILIGLWHGMTWNFLLWGLWHGFGMFIQNRWSDFTKPLTLKYEDHTILKKGWSIFSTFLTFQFVALGWVWFALPNLDSSLAVFKRLAGL